MRSVTEVFALCVLQVLEWHASHEPMLLDELAKLQTDPDYVLQSLSQLCMCCNGPKLGAAGRLAWHLNRALDYCRRMPRSFPIREFALDYFPQDPDDSSSIGTFPLLFQGLSPTNCPTNSNGEPANCWLCDVVHRGHDFSSRSTWRRYQSPVFIEYAAEAAWFDDQHRDLRQQYQRQMSYDEFRPFLVAPPVGWLDESGSVRLVDHRWGPNRRHREPTAEHRLTPLHFEYCTPLSELSVVNELCKAIEQHALEY